MRTTVTLDPDTEEVVRERMKSRSISFKQALNDAIRNGVAERAEPYRMATYGMGVPRVDLTTALQLAGELADEHTIEVMRRGR